MNKYLAITVFLIYSVVKAQDIHFSQFNEHPSLINPALTGAAAPSRFSLAYRNQWRSVSMPYTSYGASAEIRFKPGQWQQAASANFKQRVIGRLAGGIAVYKDNAGDGSMGTTRVNFSLASFVPTGRKSFLALGIQGSAVQTVVNNNNLLFPNQYNGTGYDASVPSNENFQAQNFLNGDLAAGILWTYGQNDRSMLGQKQLKANVGFSVYHLIPERSTLLVSPSTYNAIRFVSHGNFLISLSNPDYAIEPSYLIQFRQSSMEVLGGGMLKRYVKMNSKYTGLERRSFFGAGIYYRNNDALILNCALDIKEQFMLGVSYDINVSRLKIGTNAQGGAELTMRYTPPRVNK